MLEMQTNTKIWAVLHYWLCLNRRNNIFTIVISTSMIYLIQSPVCILFFGLLKREKRSSVVSGQKY